VESAVVEEQVEEELTVAAGDRNLGADEREAAGNAASTTALLTARAARSCPAARVCLMESSSSLYSALEVIEWLISTARSTPSLSASR